MTSPIFARDEVLERVDGDVEFLTDITNEFLASFPAKFSELVSAVENNDALDIERKAHSIKGALRNLGGLKSGDTAHRIEIAAKQGDMSQTKSMLQDLDVGVKEFDVEFKKFLSSI